MRILTILAIGLSIASLASGQQVLSVGAASNGIGGGGNYSFLPNGLVFDVASPVRLDSVVVYPDMAGDVVVNITTPSGTTYSRSVAVSGGGTATRIDLGFPLPAGNGYEIDAVGTTTGSLFRNISGGAYPYTSSGGELSITGAINGLTGYYYFFYDWRITTAGGPSCEDFESFSGTSLGGGWIDGGGEGDWRADSNGTSSSQTGPSTDVTLGVGQYIYYETSSPRVMGDRAIALTPIYDVGGLANPTLDFWYHMYGATMGSLEIQEWDGGGWSTLWTLSGDQGDSWYRANAPLTPVNGTVALRFVGTCGSSFTGDMALDEACIRNGMPGAPVGFFQTNSPEASIDADGVQATRTQPAFLDAESTVTANVSSTLVGMPWDWAIVPVGRPISSIEPGAWTTPGGQYVNFDVTQPILSGNGGPPAPLFLGLRLVPFPGSFSAALPPVPGAVIEANSQIIIMDPASPDGATLSQAAGLRLSTPNLGPATLTCSPAATALSLTDDSFSMQSLGFTFDYFGTGYTEVYVGSNGHLTFGGGNSGWASGGNSLNSGRPTIATLSEDLNPASGGMVTFVTNGVDTFDVCFQGVPSFPNAGSNTFQTICRNGGVIHMRYDAGLTETEGTVGLSAGGSVNTLLPLNLSTSAGFAIPPGSTPFQDFTSGSPNDLAGLEIIWVLDGSGTPIMIQ